MLLLVNPSKSLCLLLFPFIYNQSIIYYIYYYYLHLKSTEQIHLCLLNMLNSISDFRKVLIT